MFAPHSLQSTRESLSASVSRFSRRRNQGERGERTVKEVHLQQVERQNRRVHVLKSLLRVLQVFCGCSLSLRGWEVTDLPQPRGSLVADRRSTCEETRYTTSEVHQTDQKHGKTRVVYLDSRVCLPCSAHAGPSHPEDLATASEKLYQKVRATEPRPLPS